MTWTTQSGFFVLNIRGALGGGAAINMLATSHRIACFKSTITPNFSDTIANSVYAVGAWVVGGESSGTGWAAGGPLFSAAATSNGSLAPTLTDNPAGTLMYDLNDVVQTSVTLVDATGCLLYADASSPKIGFLAIPFGGNYNPVAGTFTIQWPVAGVATIDLTP